MSLPHQLPDIPFPAKARVGRPRVAKMGVVRPNGDPGIAVAPLQELCESIQGIGHMEISMVPRVEPSAIHTAVILFRIYHQASILNGVESGRILNTCSDAEQRVVLFPCSFGCGPDRT